MKVKAFLLTGVALCTLSLSSAFAKSAPDIHVMSVNRGAVVKSVMTHKTATNQTSTIAVTTDISTSADYKKKTDLTKTYYAWVTQASDLCAEIPKEKIKVSAKKTKYASLSTHIATYPGSDYGCSTTVSTYGDVYDLTTKTAVKKKDKFESYLTAKVTLQGTKYDLKLVLDVTVPIGT
jgi:hypothetical protein